MMKFHIVFFFIFILLSQVNAQDPWWEPGWTFNFKEFNPVEGPAMEVEVYWRMDHGKVGDCEGPTVHWGIGQIWINGYIRNGEKMYKIPGINGSDLVKVYSLDDVCPKELKDNIPFEVEIEYTIAYSGVRTKLRQKLVNEKSLSISLCDQPPFPTYAARVSKWYTESMIVEVKLVNATFQGQDTLKKLIDKAYPDKPTEVKSETDAFITDLMDEFDPSSSDDSFDVNAASEYILSESTKGTSEQTSSTSSDSHDPAAYQKISDLLSKMEQLLLSTLQKGMNGQYDIEDFNELERLNQEYAQLYADAKNSSLLSPDHERLLLAQHQRIQERIQNATKQRTHSTTYQNTGYSYSQVQQVNCDQIIQKLKNAEFNSESRRRDAIAYETRRCDCLNGKIWDQGNGERGLINLKQRRDEYYRHKDQVLPGQNTPTVREPDLSPVPKNCNWRKY